MKRFGPGVEGLAWAVATGVFFSLLNTLLRKLSLELHPFQTQFLRYGFGFVVLLPWIFAAGLRAYKTNAPGMQVARNLCHTAGFMVWFLALPHIPLADTTAIAFTSPIFIMLGAAAFLGERMLPARWIAVLIAFGGVLIVLAPKLSGAGGNYSLIMLASQPIFACSYLFAKALTRRDRPEVLVAWQGLLVTLFTLPFALAHWTWPTSTQWAWFALTGAIGTAGHYSYVRAMKAIDLSATQSVKFLDLIWTTTLGFLVFGDVPSQATLIGGLVIVGATVWIARREARAPVRSV